MNRCNVNLMANNTEFKQFKFNDAHSQLKIISEAGFPVKGSRTSPLYSFRLVVEVLNCLIVETS